MGVVISIYFCFCYIVLGIGLCNLLTSLIVDLMKVSSSPRRLPAQPLYCRAPLPFAAPATTTPTIYLYI